jgi:histidyl-tRNA synthetase
MASPEFARLPGFRDFAPEEMAVRTHIFDAWKRVAHRYAFREYDGPPLEALDLYVEKSGEEIIGQLYTFTDRGGRQVAMRPEMTPSLARILAERSRAMPKPIRWFSTPQLFRYERQQRGRLREHFQWNVDIVGEAGVAADAEVLAVALDGLRELGLGPDDVRARVSDRRLLAAVLRGVGVTDDRLTAAYAVIDKVERQSRERSLQRLVDEVGLDGERAESLLSLIDTPGLDPVRSAFPDDAAVCEALDRFDEYLDLLSGLGFGPFIDVDLRIVRGLAYYTGIVFEVFDARGELRAVCGGGRYDRLLELVGGQPLPAVGFGMGDVVLTELLRDLDRLPDVTPSVDYFIAIIGEELRPRALDLARRLRDSGWSVAYPLKPQAVRKQFKAAETEGARQVVVLAPDEAARGEAVVRDMGSGAERTVALADFGGAVGDR